VIRIQLSAPPGSKLGQLVRARISPLRASSTTIEPALGLIRLDRGAQRGQRRRMDPVSIDSVMSRSPIGSRTSRHPRRAPVDPCSRGASGPAGQRALERIFDPICRGPRIGKPSAAR